MSETKMSYEEILKENNGKKFDIVLMNPPYGTDGSQDLHYKFVNKCLDIAYTQVTVMPIGLIKKSSSKAIKYKENFDKYLLEVEELPSTLFKGTAMQNVGIYIFKHNKNITDNILIKLMSGNKYINSLKNINQFVNDVENNIYKIISNNGTQTIYIGPGFKTVSHDDKLFDYINKKLNNFKKFENENKNASFLVVNDANGGMNGTFMSNKVGQIINGYNELYKYLSNVKPFYNILCFKSQKEAENCKIALKNPVLRFLLYRIQDDQHMHIKKCYSYIPGDIDWSDDRVKTDEELLEVCGCPKDKCKEYAEYCKKIIEEVDRKK